MPTFTEIPQSFETSDLLAIEASIKNMLAVDAVFFVHRITKWRATSCLVWVEFCAAANPGSILDYDLNNRDSRAPLRNSEKES